jgi:hypothetical protein
MRTRVGKGDMVIQICRRAQECRNSGPIPLGLRGVRRNPFSGPAEFFSSSLTVHPFPVPAGRSVEEHDATDTDLGIRCTVRVMVANLLGAEVRPSGVTSDVLRKSAESG